MAMRSKATPGVQVAVPAPEQVATGGVFVGNAQSVPLQHRLGFDPVWGVHVSPGAHPGVGCVSQRHPLEPAIQVEARPLFPRPLLYPPHTLAVPLHPQHSGAVQVPQLMNPPQLSDTCPQFFPIVEQSAVVSGVQGVHSPGVTVPHRLTLQLL